MSEIKQSSGKTRQGVVLSNKMEKTVVVEVVRRFQHPKYPKTMKRRVRYKAHDELNDCGIGDVVMLQETRPLSKSKRWRVINILEKAPVI